MIDGFVNYWFLIWLVNKLIDVTCQLWFFYFGDLTYCKIYMINFILKWFSFCLKLSYNWLMHGTYLCDWNFGYYGYYEWMNFNSFNDLICHKYHMIKWDLIYHKFHMINCILRFSFYPKFYISLIIVIEILILWMNAFAFDLKVHMLNMLTYT